MLKRLAVVMLVFVAVRVDALEYTDVYYNPNESGWGVFLVQSDTTQFLALFIYGPDGKPTWYVATVADNGTGGYGGALFATTGTYFAIPWQGATGVSVGTLTFQPTDSYHATLTYTVNGVGTVTKTVQRQTLAAYNLAGAYSGSISGTITSCANPAGNTAAFRPRFNLAVTQVNDQSATLAFSFVDENTGIACSISGPLTHLGRLYRMVDAQHHCTGPGTDPGFYAVTVEGLHPTGQGIEGRWTGTLGGGCSVSMHFTGVLN